MVTDAGLKALRALAGRWRAEGVNESAAADLEAVLDEIEASRAAGGDLLRAFVKGDGIPEMHAAAQAKARELWGPDALTAVEATGEIATPVSRRWRFAADVWVRCLNYASLPAWDPEASDGQ